MMRWMACLCILAASTAARASQEKVVGNGLRSSGASAPLMRVVIPVVDLRSEPKDAPRDTYGHDPLQESQILFGEPVRVHQIDGEWARVEVERQREYTHKKLWEGYPGWVRVDALEDLPPSTSGTAEGVVRRGWADVLAAPIGGSARLIQIPSGARIESRARRGEWLEIDYRGGRRGYIRARDVMLYGVEPLPRSRIETQVWRFARTFIGAPYYWGGLSPLREDYKRAMTGVDCSGLTHLAYRVSGVDIPRDSHEQWMTAKAVRRREMRRGDLVFVASEKKPDRVTHVAMYVGGEFMIEGPGTGMSVRRVTFKKKFGMRLSQIESGDTVGGKIIYFGRPPADGG